MSNNYLLLIFLIFINNLKTISTTIILPFNYKNKKEHLQNSNNNEKTTYFENLMDNTIYTSMKVYNQDIDFHLSMERYPIYINDEIYKKFNDKNIDNKKDTISLYSLDRIGINRASLINKTFTVKSDTNSENEIEEINLFRARKFLNYTEIERNRMGYASEEAEIGFNIVRGSQYLYVEEMENDIDTQELQDEFEREKEREKAYEEFYNLKKNKTTSSDLPSYNPLDEYDYLHDYEDDQPKNPYDNNDIYNYDNDDANNNKTQDKKENKNENNKKENDKKEENKEKERFLGDGLFKEESANFISQLKKKDKINSFAFTIKYNSNSNNEENGEIIIGDLPHEYAPDTYSPENYFFDSVSITKEPPFNWHFIYKKCSYGQEQIDTRNSVKFSIDFGFIRGNKNLQKTLEENFFNLNSCYKDKTKNNYYIYYCTEKAIKNLKPIIFELESKYCPTNLNAKFEFNYKDLFIKDENKDNDIYYFQIVFPSDGSYSNWIFGKPLFKKYQMVFDQDRKTYGFYVKLNEKKSDNSNNSLKISWTLVIILIIVSLVLGYILCKLINKLPRRLKANELEDSFTYDPSSSKYSQIKENKIGNIPENNERNKLYENL